MPIAQETDNIDAFKDALLAAVSVPTPERLLYIAEAMRHDVPLEKIYRICKFDMWYLERIKNIIDAEKRR